MKKKGGLAGLTLAKPQRITERDPVKIFRGLTLREGSIENIWAPQEAALNEWFSKREEADLLIQMNTGGGKTLVGLLISKSACVESKSGVVYLCPTKQLVEQTLSQAKQLGIEAAAYFGKSTWIDKNVFDTGRGPCIATYAAFFNGKSVFRRTPIDTVVLDDAHVAGHVIRDSFTLRLPKQSGRPLETFLELFHDHFRETNQISSIHSVLNGKLKDVIFIPSYLIKEKIGQVQELFGSNEVIELAGNTFSWPYLHDILPFCTFIVGFNGLEVTPAVIPIDRCLPFSHSSHRVYLTASTPSRAEFIRTFGNDSPATIRPPGKLGESQRLFMFIGNQDDYQHAINRTKELITQYKAAIIVPSWAQFKRWEDVAEPFNSDDGEQRLARFKNAKEPEKLGLVARYDGIDLPGDTCRVLVLDGVPRGQSLLETFFIGKLRSVSIERSIVSTRLVQSIGRIFRSNTDRGAVLVSSPEVFAWLAREVNRTTLPTLIQQQIQFGLALSDAINSEQITWEELLRGVYTGSEDWQTLYERHVNYYDAEEAEDAPDWFIESLKQEAEGFKALYQSNYKKAADSFQSGADEAGTRDKKYSAWLKHWLGLSRLYDGDAPSSLQILVSAANEVVALGRPKLSEEHVRSMTENGSASMQARRLVNLIEKEGIASLRSRAGKAVSNIKATKAHSILEAELHELGRLLGLEVERPDNEGRMTGPDVLWHLDGMAAVIEAKTEKKDDSIYSKKDIGQFYDHIAWVENVKNLERIASIIVGNANKVDERANPPDDLLIIGIEEFSRIARSTAKLFDALERYSFPEGVAKEDVVEAWLDYYGLRWPQVVTSMNGVKAVDMRDI